MSGGRDATEPGPHPVGSDAHGDGERPDPRAGPPLPTVAEALTILSVPSLLLVVNFAVQPVFAAWPKLRYVRYPVARTTPPTDLAPDPLTGVAWWWHELTRLTHAVVHHPALHTHVLWNAALITVAAAALLGFLAALGRRRWFVYLYWELAVVAPVVGSYAFDLFGRTVHGYGASAVGFAFFGALSVFCAALALRRLRHAIAGRTERATPGRFAGRSPFRSLTLVGVLLLIVGGVGVDLAAGSPATPVHQAGFGFGVLVGAVALAIVAFRPRDRERVSASSNS